MTTSSSFSIFPHPVRSFVFDVSEHTGPAVERLDAEPDPFTLFPNLLRVEPARVDLDLVENAPDQRSLTNSRNAREQDVAIHSSPSAI